MTASETVILAAYFFVLVILAVYGWHRYYLVFVYMRNKDRQPVPQGTLETLPVVTIQLPIYNEMYVTDRLIDAVCQIDYPRELLEIQVLDDSTDETSGIAERAVGRHPPRGDISYIHRTDRTGYKAGALEAGMKRRAAASSRSSTPTSSRRGISRAHGAVLQRRVRRDGAGAVGASTGTTRCSRRSVDSARRPL
jgi:cellulose synthase/poly-beta-1,6-N-acetylglucosamine synthase-like glycosyltransferase